MAPAQICIELYFDQFLISKNKQNLKVISDEKIFKNI